MKTLLQNLIVLGITLLICAAGLEVVLRSAPGLITVADLAHFPSAGLRGELAAARGLPTAGSVVRLERPFGGPEVALPRDTQFRPIDEVDAAYGGIAQETRTGGFCNRNAPAGISPELVVVGDSMVHCTSVTPEQSWVYLLGERLGLEPLNLGMPGQGMYEYRDALFTLVDTSRLRTVVVAYAEGNDIRDGLQYLRHLERYGEGAEAPSDTERGEAWLLRHSYFLNTVAAKLEVLGGIAAEVFGKADFRYTVRTAEGEVAMNIANADHNEIRYAERHRDGEFDAALIERLFEEPMVQIAEWAAAEEVELVFIYLPSAHTAYGARTSYVDSGIGELVRGFSAYQRGVFDTVCARQGLSCLDMTPRLAEQLADAPLAYFPANVHLTPEGNRIVAELLARYLEGR